MGIRAKGILSRLTGVSTPVGGVSWDPPESQREAATRVLAYLEDRRVLYSPTELEVPQHCVDSVLEIRRFLSSEIGKLHSRSHLREPLRGMRAACRKFLDTVGADDRVIPFGREPWHYASWVFGSALGELRGVFGIIIARVATGYNLDVEEPLASIIPSQDED